MIDFEKYFTQISAVNYQFDMSETALNTFLATKKAVEKFLKDDLREMRELIISAIEDKKYDLTQHSLFAAKGERMQIKGSKKILNDSLKTTHNRLIQNKLILVLAIFESFMRDIHKEILIQKSGILKNDKQISSDKRISPEKKKIMLEEIDRRIYALDKKNIAEKTEYFKDELGIEWFEGKVVPLLEHIIKVRDKILHNDHEYKVSEFEIDLAFVICHSIPYITVAQAAILYPNGFKLPLGLTRQRAKQFCRKKS